MPIIVGFHGTSLTAANSIVDNGLTPSLGDEHWLGDGGYYFLDGLSEPFKSAERWAVLEAYDRSKKVNTYDKYGLISSEINVEHTQLLDCTKPSGRELLEYFSERFDEHVRKSSAKKRRKKRDDANDGEVINWCRGDGLLNIKVSIGNVYIQLTRDARKNHIKSRVANCTICAVFDPNDNVQSTQVIACGKIESYVFD